MLFLAQVKSVIAKQDYNGIFTVWAFIESLQNLSDTVVSETN